VKKSFAEILKRSFPEKTQETETWTTVLGRKTKQQQQQQQNSQFTPQRTNDPSERHVFFLREENNKEKTDLQALLLTLNMGLMKKKVPSHVRFLNLHYTAKGSISGRLGEKALAKILVPSYSDLLVTIAKTIDPEIIGIGLAEQWQSLRVHRVQFNRYLVPEGLSLLQKEIETTQGIILPLSPVWLKPLISI
jgi:hypothetical protein